MTAARWASNHLLWNLPLQYNFTVTERLCYTTQTTCLHPLLVLLCVQEIAKNISLWLIYLSCDHLYRHVATVYHHLQIQGGVSEVSGITLGAARTEWDSWVEEPLFPGRDESGERLLLIWLRWRFFTSTQVHSQWECWGPGCCVI